MAFDAVWIEHDVAEHLIAGADAEHATAAANVSKQIDVPALRAEELEIGDGGLAAGKDDQRRIERQAAAPEE